MLEGLLETTSGLFEIYADEEMLQLDLIFLVRNCLRSKPSLGQISLKKLPLILPGLKTLATSLQNLAEQLPFAVNG